MMSKTCPRCSHPLPLGEFALDKSRKDGLAAYCLICDRTRKHNITRNEYLALLERQNGKCGFPDCDRPPLEIDHDHRCCPTGKRSCGRCIRAVLCSKHNMALGQFADSIENLREGIEYLKNFDRCLWEILVPVCRADGKEIDIPFHQLWDEKVRAVSGGLTITRSVRGQWIFEDKLFSERVIPCRVMATRWEMNQIAKITIAHYSDQLAVMFYRLSESAIIMMQDN